MDLYMPRFTRGKEPAKQGLFAIYHLQYLTTYPHTRAGPSHLLLKFNVMPRPNAAKNERTEMKEALYR
ncbi:hypothetical protein H0H87_012288, partial [Tephrocybe sp. NHM501043]